MIENKIDKILDKGVEKIVRERLIKKNKMREFTTYFRGSLSIEAESIEEAWEKWMKFQISFDCDDVDIYEEKT